jgi:integrase
MARKRNTTTAVKSKRQEGFHRDHGDGSVTGLYLQVSKSSKKPKGVTKSWVFRYVSPITRKRRWHGLGSADAIGLAKARELARAAREQVALGNDPIEERHATKAARREAHLREIASTMSFKECSDSYLREHLATYTNPKHRQQWVTSLDRANKAFGDLNVASIDVDVIVKFLAPIWEATTESASRIRGRIEKVLDWATARKFRSGENPARWQGHLEHLLKAKPKAKHHAALPFADLPAFMAELRERGSISARALELCILTACRTGEVIGARWEEIEGDVWTVPASRMKAKRAHRVPLSDRALAILGTLPRDSSGFVFPGAVEGKSISNMAMLELLKGMNGGGLTVHGFRSTFSDWARERTNYPRDVVEMALAHAIKDKTEAAYRRGDALPKRVRLMQAWADFCQSTSVESAEVVPIRA